MESCVDVVKVLIVDDHPMFSDALNATLESEAGISVLAQVYDSRDAKEKIDEYNPNVVLMDYNMPYLNGIDLTRMLLHEKPELKILIVSMYNEEWLIESFKSIGAKGYLFKAASVEEVVRAARKVNAGEYYFPPTGEVNTQDENGLLKKLKLSSRELEVIHLVKAGLKTKDIAEHLQISHYTAETHLKNIKLKAGVRSEADFSQFISDLY